MKNTARNLVSNLLLLVITASISLGCVEWLVRAYIIADNVDVLEVVSTERPFFRLVRTWKSPSLTIRNHRHELYPRGKRSKAVALLGDSVAFGVAVDEHDAFSERVQNNQTTFDIYNYGVPGYGLPEIEQTLINIPQDIKFEAVIYVFNFNDAMTTMPGYLSLLTKPEDRITTIDRYRGWYGAINGFVKDHVKFLIVLKHVVDAFHEDEENENIDNEILCHSSVRKYSEARSYRLIYDSYLHQYHDPFVVDEIVKRLRQMKSISAERGAELIMMASYDFLVIEQKNRELIEWPKILAEMAGIEFIDVSPAIIDAQQRCGLYGDPDHPGPLGHQIFTEAILKRLKSPL